MTFHTRLTRLEERRIPMSINYIIGSLFPKNADGKPNIKLSSSLATTKGQGNFKVVNKDKSKNSFKQQLKADLNITSDPVTIRGVNKFLTEWYIPEVSAKLNDDGSVNENSIFGGVYIILVYN